MVMTITICPVIVITIRSNWFLSLYSGQIVIVITISSNWFLSLYSEQIVIVVTSDGDDDNNLSAI
jgi:hypothetical protein